MPELSNQQLRDFIDTFKKPMPVVSIKDFQSSGTLKFEKLLKTHNHEIWQKCECGGEEDLRMTFTCSQCGATLFTNSNNN